MNITVDHAAPIPPFEQIRAHIASLIEGGTLVIGERLPPIRQLAGDLGVAPGTVARAYRELEQAGLLHTQGRHGTRVAVGRDAAVKSRRATQAAEDFARVTHALGVGRKEALRAVEIALGP